MKDLYDMNFKSYRGFYKNCIHYNSIHDLCTVKDLVKWIVPLRSKNIDFAKSGKIYVLSLFLDVYFVFLRVLINKCHLYFFLFRLSMKKCVIKYTHLYFFNKIKIWIIHTVFVFVNLLELKSTWNMIP
jgi:hypothetical protein